MFDSKWGRAWTELPAKSRGAFLLLPSLSLSSSNPHSLARSLSPPASLCLRSLLSRMPPSRIPLTFPPRTRSRSSTKSSSSSSSTHARLSKSARFPSGYAFSPSNTLSTSLPSPTPGGSSSEGSGSRAASPAASSVSGSLREGPNGGSTGDSTRGSTERDKRSQSLGGVANLPSILVS